MKVARRFVRHQQEIFGQAETELAEIARQASDVGKTS